MRDAELEQLYARLERPVYNVVYRWVWNPEEAQDIVQEAFVRLWRMRERIEPSSVDSLVYRIALNLAASRVRRRKIWRMVSLEALRGGTSSESGPEGALAADEERTRVRAAVLALPDDLRQIVMLCEYSELSYAEVGRTLGIPVGTVGSKRHRALKLLREKLGEEPVGEERTVEQTV